ncbi:MAG: hypothetical protein Q8P41_25030 [Pseudomonadota bacterium]|nr:hypothetical protein [Pseudomonadota bacterium]
MWEPARAYLSGVRFLVYGVLGCFCELAWSGLWAAVRYRDPSLKGRVSVWMFPIYGLGLGAGFDLLAAIGGTWAWPLRGVLYALAVWLVELAVGLPTRNRLWDYSGTRWSWRGVLRWDYGPVWAAFGLLLEPVRRFVDGALAASGVG